MNVKKKNSISAMAEIRHWVTYIFILIITSLMVVSCASSKLVSRGGQEIFISTQKKIVILPPTLRYESMENDVELSSSEYQGEAVRIFLMEYTLEILRNKGFDVLDSDVLANHNSGFKAVYNKVLQKSGNLFNSSIDSELTNDVKEIGEYSGHAEILAIDLRVKIEPGPGWSWNFATGLTPPGPEMNRSILRAVLINPETGSILWINAVLIRKIPKPNNSNFKEAINVLFQNIKTRKGG